MKKIIYTILMIIININLLKATEMIEYDCVGKNIQEYIPQYKNIKKYDYADMIMVNNTKEAYSDTFYKADLLKLNNQEKIFNYIADESSLESIQIQIDTLYKCMLDKSLPQSKNYSKKDADLVYLNMIKQFECFKKANK